MNKSLQYIEDASKLAPGMEQKLWGYAIDVSEYAGLNSQAVFKALLYADASEIERNYDKYDPSSLADFIWDEVPKFILTEDVGKRNPVYHLYDTLDEAVADAERISRDSRYIITVEDTGTDDCDRFSGKWYKGSPRK